MDMNSCRKALLGRNQAADAEDWLIDNVCRKEGFHPTTALARNFLLDEFSRPFLESLSQHLYGTGYREILGPYYEYISAEGGENKIPYYKVGCFKRKYDSKLRSYLSTITARHFTKLRAKELEREREQISIEASDKIKSNFWECDLKENEWFGLLLIDDSAENDTIHNQLLWSKVEKAMQSLPERERRVLQLTVMDKAPGLEVFEELAQHMNSKRNQADMTDKDKQQAVAVLKNHAIAHLTKLMKK